MKRRVKFAHFCPRPYISYNACINVEYTMRHKVVSILRCHFHHSFVSNDLFFLSVFKYNMHFTITSEYSHVYCVLYIELLFNIILIRPSSAGPAHVHGPLLLTSLIPAWPTNYMPIERWNEINYPFPNFNDITVEVWEQISNLSPYFILDVITYPCPLPLWLQIFQHQNETEPSRGTARN